MQRYMIRPLQHGLDLSQPSLNAPFSHAYWPSKNFKVTQRSAQKRWGYDLIDRDLGTGVEVQAIVLYQTKAGVRHTLYLTPTELIKKEAASGKTWSYLTESYTTGSIASVTGKAVVGDGTVWYNDVAKDDYFILDNDHTSDEEPDSNWVKISSVTDNTNIILASSQTAKSDATLNYDSGSEEPSAGDVLDGATSGASGTVLVVTKDSGTWGGTAAGSITMQSCSGRFHDDENVDINGGTANVLTINQPNSAAGVDLIQNGEFSVDTDPPPGWTASGATLTTEGTGQVTNCMQVASSGNALGKAYQDITTVVGTSYKLSLYFKKGTSASGRYMIGITTDEDSIYDSTALTDAAWAAKSHAFEATATTTRITMETTDATATENSLFDEISLYELPYGKDYKIRKVYTTPTNERWSWCIVDDKFIFTNGNTNVQYWAGANYAADLETTADPPEYAIKARHCIPYANRLFIADYWTTRDPLKIGWSKEGDPNNWTDDTSGTGTLIESRDFITGLGVVGASLVIYKTDSIAFGHRTGVSAAPISIPQTRERRGIGCVAPYSIIDFMGTNAFIGRNDFYIIEGEYPVAIGGKIRDRFFDIVNLDDIKKVYGFENGITNELCWLASTSEGELCFTWDYKLKEWNVYDFEADLVMAGKGAI